MRQKSIGNEFFNPIPIQPSVSPEGLYQQLAIVGKEEVHHGDTEARRRA
jgi:hypothetical protein